MNDQTPIEIKSEVMREGHEAPAAYHKPQVVDLGALEQVQQYYDGTRRDGPTSSYWYR